MIFAQRSSGTKQQRCPLLCTVLCVLSTLDSTTSMSSALGVTFDFSSKNFPKPYDRNGRVMLCDVSLDSLHLILLAQAQGSVLLKDRVWQISCFKKIVYSKKTSSSTSINMMGVCFPQQILSSKISCLRVLSDSIEAQHQSLSENCVDPKMTWKLQEFQIPTYPERNIPLNTLNHLQAMKENPVTIWTFVTRIRPKATMRMPSSKILEFPKKDGVCGKNPWNNVGLGKPVVQFHPSSSKWILQSDSWWVM